jgi:glycosyltransferase involved in cell wall biosynthesis
MSYKLTVGIISYNRPHELVRCLQSVLPIPSNVEVLICDDFSPKRDEIASLVKKLQESHNNINFIINEKNYGYDKNLYNVLELASGEFVLLLGDDDMLESHALINLIENLSSFDINTAFLRVRCSDSLLNRIGRSSITYERNYQSTKYFPPEEIYVRGDHIYHSILFSGLIFKRESVLTLKGNIEGFFSSIYIQVALFGLLCSKHGSYFLEGPGIMIGSDGENGFGLNDAADERDIQLRDRDSVVANLNYQVRLIEVMKRISSFTSRRVFDVFIREYRIRFVKAAWTSRKRGLKDFYDFFTYSRKLRIEVGWKVFLILMSFFIIPKSLLGILLESAENFIHLRRGIRKSL